VQLFVNATAHDDLLALQRAADQAVAAAAGGSINGSSSGKEGMEILPVLKVDQGRQVGCIQGWQQQIDVVEEGLMLPWRLLEAVQDWQDMHASRSSSSSSMDADMTSNCQECLDKGGNYGGSAESAVSNSSSSSGYHQIMADAGDPVCWDTDDNDDRVEHSLKDIKEFELPAEHAAAAAAVLVDPAAADLVGSPPAAAAAAAAPVSLLLVLDIEQCLQQFCSVPTDMAVN
jgi:hypothetical protein